MIDTNYKKIWRENFFKNKACDRVLQWYGKWKLGLANLITSMGKHNVHKIRKANLKVNTRGSFIPQKKRLLDANRAGFNFYIFHFLALLWFHDVRFVTLTSLSTQTTLFCTSVRRRFNVMDVVQTSCAYWDRTVAYLIRC